MMTKIDYYIYVKIPFHEGFSVMVRDQTVRKCPPYRRWMIGKDWGIVKKWLKRHKSEIRLIKEQAYII